MDSKMGKSIAIAVLGKEEEPGNWGGKFVICRQYIR